MEDMKDKIAQNIKYFRKKRNFTQRELAEQIGVKHNTVAAWEKGTNAVDIDSLFKICSALNISINSMLDIKKSESNTKSQNVPEISDNEISLIEAYRRHPEMHPAIHKMLDINLTESFREETYLMGAVTKK